MALNARPTPGITNLAAAMILSFRTDATGLHCFTKSADREQSDQGLHCLLFHLHLLDALFHGRT